MQSKKYKASVLAVTLIMMAIILASALSIATVSVRERKSSIGSNKSSWAYQAADMGVENVLGILLANPPEDTLSSVSWGSNCSCETVAGYLEKWIVCDNNNYRVQLKKQTAPPPNATFEDIDCDSIMYFVSDINRIKSIGTDSVKQTQRAIGAEVPVVIP